MSQSQYRLKNQIRTSQTPSWGTITGTLSDQTDLQTAIDNAGGGGGGTGSLFFDASKLQHINCGRFWRPNVSYSHFFWEFTAKPYVSGTNWTGYILSDNHGGAHNLLFGIQMGSNGLFNVTGNIWNGSGVESFSTAESFQGDHWHVFAVGWDGSHIMLWVDGVLSSIKAYSGTRSQPGGNNFCLHLGGSDHNNYWGNIAQVRGFEGYGRCRFAADYTPELHFRPLSVLASYYADQPQFNMNLMTDQTLYADTSVGFEGHLHHGVPSAVLSAQNSGAIAPSVNDFTLPTFQAGALTFGTHTPTPPATPANALVWDSFSRADATYLTKDLIGPADGNSTIGSTEAGSLGQLEWLGTSGAFPNSTGAILNGRVALIYQGADSILATGVRNVDIRVDRLNLSYCYTSILFRYKDGNDYYGVWGNDSGLILRKREGGVTTDVGIAVNAGWITLRIVANGTSLTVYTGTATEGVFTQVHTDTITDVVTATNHGLLNTQYGLKTMYRADNFLIKAA